MATLPKGGNAPLAAISVRAVLSWTERGAAHDIDLCALLIGTNGHVRNDSDFVFYNQPSHPSNAVKHEGKSGTSDRVLIEVDQLPDDVEKVVLAASISGGTFGLVKELALAVTEAGTGTEEHRFDSMGATSETAFVVGEIYKRNDAWKFRAVGQGWNSGLAGLATSYGVNIGADPEEVAPGPEPTPGAVAATAPATPTPQAAEPTPPPQPIKPVDPPVERVIPDVPENKPEPIVLPRLRVTAVVAPRNGDTLDSESLTLPLGQTVTLTRSGAPAAKHFWLRVTRTNAETALSVDLCALTYDSYGALRDTIYYGVLGASNGSIGLVNQPIGTTPDATSAVEFNLDSIDRETTGIVLAAVSYTGQPLSALGSIVTELVDESGVTLVRTECPATRSSSALLVSLTRGDDGVWFMASVGTPASGRSARSLVGAGYWALSA